MRAGGGSLERRPPAVPGRSRTDADALRPPPTSSLEARLFYAAAYN